LNILKTIAIVYAILLYVINYYDDFPTWGEFILYEDSLLCITMIKSSRSFIVYFRFPGNSICFRCTLFKFYCHSVQQSFFFYFLQIKSIPIYWNWGYNL